MQSPSAVMKEVREGAARYYVAKITGIEPLNIPGIPGCERLKFGEIDSQANVLGYWIAQNSPQIGGWFVVPETGGAGFMRDADFQNRFGGLL